MNAVLLRGLRRPKAVVCSGSPFYLRAVRCQSSEPEQVAEEEHHDFEGHAGAFSSSDNAPIPEALPHGCDTDVSPLNGLTSSQLPWAAFASTLPSKPQQQLNRNDKIPDALARSRPGGASTAVSVPLPWEALSGLQQPPGSKLNGEVTPRSLRDEGSRAPLGTSVGSQQEALPSPVTRDTAPRAHPLHSIQQNTNAQHANPQSAVRLPWERMLDGLPSKPKGGVVASAPATGSAEQTCVRNLEGLSKGLAASGRAAEWRLNGGSNQQVRREGVVRLGWGSGLGGTRVCRASFAK